MNKSLSGVLLVTLSVIPLTSGCFLKKKPHAVAPKPVEPPLVEPVVVAQAPPSPQPEVIPTAPAPGFVWIPGYWSWQGRWLWIPGTWVPGPHPNAKWVAGHWSHNIHGYVWIPGHWK